MPDKLVRGGWHHPPAVGNAKGQGGGFAPNRPVAHRLDGNLAGSGRLLARKGAGPPPPRSVTAGGLPPAARDKFPALTRKGRGQRVPYFETRPGKEGPGRLGVSAELFL